MVFADLHERIAMLRRLDIQGPGPNVLNWAALQDLAQQVVEVLDVDEL